MFLFVWSRIQAWRAVLHAHMEACTTPKVAQKIQLLKAAATLLSKGVSINVNCKLKSFGVLLEIDIVGLFCL